MAISRFLFGRTPQVTKLALNEVFIDATISIETSQSSEATKNPIEDGNDITDHVRISPLSLSLECFISDAPLGDIASLVTTGVIGGTVAGLAGNAIIGGASLVGAGIGSLASNTLGSKTSKVRRNPNDAEYPKKAFKTLLEAQKARNPFSIQTFFTETLYTNMIITELSFPQSVEDGNGLRFNMSCEQIRIVQAETDAKVKESDFKGAQAAQSGSDKVDKARQGTQPPAPKTGTELLQKIDELDQSFAAIGTP